MERDTAFGDGDSDSDSDRHPNAATPPTQHMSAALQERNGVLRRLLPSSLFPGLHGRAVVCRDPSSLAADSSQAETNRTVVPSSAHTSLHYTTCTCTWYLHWPCDVLAGFRDLHPRR